VAGAAIIEYEGMIAEVVWSGIKAGSNGSTTTSSTGTGAGAAAGADFFFFLVAFFLAPEAAAIPTQMHRMATKRTHAMIGMKNPAEPEATEPELAWEPDESPEVKESNEPKAEEPERLDFNEAEESEEEPDEESHGVSVVVGVSVGTAGALTADFFVGFGVVVTAIGTPIAIAVPTPAPMAIGTPAPTPTPMAIFSSFVRP